MKQAKRIWTHFCLGFRVEDESQEGSSPPTKVSIYNHSLLGSFCDLFGRPFRLTCRDSGKQNQ